MSQPHCIDKNGENALLGGRKLFLNFVAGSLDDDGAIFGDHIPQDLVKAAKSGVQAVTACCLYLPADLFKIVAILAHMFRFLQ